jgi:CIC family chloride channel protein
MATGSFERYKRFKCWILGMPENVRLSLFSALLGFAAAFAVILFMWSIEGIKRAVEIVSSDDGIVWYMVATLLIIIVSGFIVGLLMKKVPEAAGSGVPQLKAAYWRENGFIAFRSVAAKFIAGIVSIGGGFSLGREGPSIYLGGGVASNLSGFLGISNGGKRQASLVGASAGLAAAFNTPLAAITFTLEEIIGELNTKYAGAVVLASVVGALTVHAFIGKQPAFNLPAIGGATWFHLIGVPVTAAVAALLGVTLQGSILSIRRKIKNGRYSKSLLLPVAGALITWILAVSVFIVTGHKGVFGLGYEDLSMALDGSLPWKIAFALAVAKLAATIAGYSFGGCGGIFAPSLFIGGLSGYFIASSIAFFVPLNSHDVVVLSVIGMSACLGAVVHAPLTSMLIVFEMTHQFELVPGLMMGAIISHSIARSVGRLNLYDALLIQDGHELIKIKPPRNIEIWRNVTVNEIMRSAPVTASSTRPEELAALLQKNPFERFPLVVNGVIEGVLSREAIARSLDTKDEPVIEVPVRCAATDTVKDISNRFIDSKTGMIIVCKEDGCSIAGIVTIHDLLRWQSSIS